MATYGDGCLGGAHAWSEWAYSEEAAEAVRACSRCGHVVSRSGRALIPPHRPDLSNAPPGRARVTPDDVLAALGGSIFSAELRGSFASARALADRLLTGASSPAERADGAIIQAGVRVLQGEPVAADRLVDDVDALVPGDADRRLRALTWTLLAIQERYNTNLDDAGVGATEVNARWQGAGDLAPLDAAWQSAQRAAGDPIARMEGWLVYSFLSQLRPLRYTFDSGRDMPLAVPREQLMEMAMGLPSQLRAMGDAQGIPAWSAFAEWTAADLYRRSGDADAAQAALQRARGTYRAAGDAAGEALCLMTAADWMCAPVSSPLAWNFIVVDSSSQGSHLAVQTEAREFTGTQAIARDPGPVEDLYDAAERLFESAGATRGVAAVRIRRGYLGMLQDDWAAAAAHTASARELFAAAGDRKGEHLAATHLLLCGMIDAALAGGDPLALAAAIGRWGRDAGSFSFALHLGVLVNRLSRHWLMRHGRYERALACSRAARALFEALGADINATQSLVDHGVIHQAVGERSLAITFFSQALDEYTQQLERWPNVAENLRSRAAFLAVDAYQLALQQCDSDGMERATARLRGHLPRIQFAPLRQMAESLIAQCGVLAPLYRARIERARGNEVMAEGLIDRARAGLDAVAGEERHFLEVAVLAERRQYAEAATAIARHVRAGGANAGFVGELTELMKRVGGAHGLAEAALQDRRTHEQAFTAYVMVRAYEQARQHLQALERLAGADWWASDPRPWQPLADVGQMYEGLGETDRALEYYDRAIQELESRRQFLSRDELKVALASDKGAQYLYLSAARAAVRSGRAALGFEYAERGKARALLDLMAATRIAPSANEDAVTREWREASMDLFLARSLLARARSAESPDQTRIAALDAQVSEREARLAQAEQALAARNPRFHEAVHPTAPTMSPAEVAAALERGAVLIEYFFLGDDLLAWAVRKDAPPVVHHAAMDAAALARTIRQCHRACQDLLPYDQQASELSTTLLSPLADAIRGSRHVIVVPHGAAHALPFHVLPFDGEPLAAHRTISYLPSASALQFMDRGDAEGELPDRILIVGNPTLDLPSSRAEAESVARLFGGAFMLLEEAATEQAVRAHLAEYPLVHFATHGTLDEEMPLQSSLELAGGDSLTVYELMLLRLQARLVVLSACSTAQGETTGGDDVLGLTRGLLAAGARSAVVTLWPVDDDSTALFMETFYKSLRSGAAPAAALHVAQTQLRAMHAKGYQHPYYWAPFVVVGRA